MDESRPQDFPWSLPFLPSLDFLASLDSLVCSFQRISHPIGALILSFPRMWGFGGDQQICASCSCIPDCSCHFSCSLRYFRNKEKRHPTEEVLGFMSLRTTWGSFRWSSRLGPRKPGKSSISTWTSMSRKRGDPWSQGYSKFSGKRASGWFLPPHLFSWFCVDTPVRECYIFESTESFIDEICPDEKQCSCSKYVSGTLHQSIHYMHASLLWSIVCW